MVACSNIIGSGHSMYKWQGDIKQEEECYIIFKVSKKKVSAVRDMIEELHDYDTPCIAEISIKSLNDSYLSWLKNTI